MLSESVYMFPRNWLVSGTTVTTEQRSREKVYTSVKKRPLSVLAENIEFKGSRQVSNTWSSTIF